MTDKQATAKAATKAPSNLLTSINHNIGVLAKSEKITRKVLAEVANELLLYVPGSNDIDAVNRLVAVLTPVNKQAAILFFKSMLQWSFVDGVFTTIQKGERTVSAKNERRLAFIKSEETFWSWVDDNTTIEAKPKDFQNDIVNLIKRATKDGDYQISHAQVIQSVLASGITIQEVLTMVNAQQQREERKAA